MLSDFSTQHHAQAFSEFLAYKTRVPVRGAIMLNQDMDEVVLVKGWKKAANWSFPRGKINKDEPDLDCAVREVYEETGFDLKAEGLVSAEEETKSIEVTMREQHMRLYVFRGVPMEANFEPRTRKEISKIQWYKLTELPTVKKKKLQQEGQGQELAVNANKFYMVAPFLGPLKKWIAQQRRLDRARRFDQNAPVHDGEVAPDAEDNYVDENHVAPSSNDDLSRLLDGLRQSSLPETSRTLEVPTNRAQTIESTTDLPAKSGDLLALLRGSAAKQRPQTPAAQIIEQPMMPHSPHHHAPLQRISTLPKPPDITIPAAVHPQFQLVSQNSEHSPGLFTPLTGSQPQVPRVRAIPPPKRAAQLVPRALTSSSKPLRHGAPAPYQRTGDPLIMRDTHAGSGDQASMIPAASKLPPPRLTAQSAVLLDLFKKDSSASQSDRAEMATVDASHTAGTPDHADMLLPSQETLQLSEKKSVPPKTSTSDHQANLLSMFRTTSTKGTRPSGLQPPPGPVELSAQPSPGHSREPSHHVELPPLSIEPSISAQIKPDIIRIRQKEDETPVFATIKGPLDLPRFDMVAKSNREVKNGDRMRRSPMQILTRPMQLHADSDAKLPHAADNHTAPRKMQAPSLVTPVKPIVPPKPSLKGQEAPPKPFQPQILRRQGVYSGELSPIQPLPSPKHKAAPNTRTGQTADQKKSLLSLFTKPSPFVSPTSAAPSTGLDLASLVSPLSDKPSTQQEKSKNVFSNPPDIMRSKVDNDGGLLLDGRSLSSSSNNIATSSEGKKLAGSAAKPTPAPTPTTTPLQKDFLRGYLAGVAKGGL